MYFPLLYIIWSPSEVALQLGPLSIRWYSLCWLIGLGAAFFLMQRFFKDQKLKDQQFEPLLLYCFIGILVGARLGHCLFYEPDYYLSSGQHFLEMLLPARPDAVGKWHITGYAGLASHGGMIGITLALWLYSRNLKVPFVQLVDMIGIVGPLTGFFIRMGNLMNSEIIGRVTDVPWAFVFTQVDSLPRHPGQLYEAIAYLCIFFLLFAIYKKHTEWTGTGIFIGLTLALVFTARFFIEFFKDIQVDFESSMPIDMGQLLSIPFVLLGWWFIRRALKK